MRSAYQAFGVGDVEPLVGLLHSRVVWSGRRRLSRFWQRPPCSRGPDEARVALTRAARARPGRGFLVDRVEQVGDRVLVLSSWADENWRLYEWSQVLRLRGGRIIRMEDYASPRRAAAALRLHAPLGSSSARLGGARAGRADGRPGASGMTPRARTR